MRLLIFGVFACAVLASTTEALECYICQNATDTTSCTNTMQCSSQEACFHQTTQTSSGILHDMGCLDTTTCSNKAVSPGLVGRSIQTRQQHGCHQCCSINLCNSNLCSQKKPSDCIDEPTFDCARADTLFSMCQDIEHAKTICPRYCKLCDVVDGNWSVWNTWSSCDVTCSNGSRSRDRSCTNPVPANGGSDCIGQSRETTQCTMEPCPVNGGWALWSSWGYCSVSCGVGMLRRDRSCSNPYPDKHGEPCYGDSRDDRVCMDQPCANGGWSVWQSWESCSVTCGVGMRHRTRLCNNPAPSPFGHVCQGESKDYELCNSAKCHDIVPAFAVTHPKSYTGGKLSWSTQTLIQGISYNNATGVFTCSKPGIYYIYTNLIKPSSSSAISYTGCRLYKNSHDRIQDIIVDPYVDSYDHAELGSEMATNAILVHLSVGDIVYLGSCSNPITSIESHSTFTGFLLDPDN